MAVLVMMMVAWVEILPGAIVTCDLTQDILGGWLINWNWCVREGRTPRTS